MTKKPFEVFSKRQRRVNGEMPDVYQYSRIPAPLRVQVDFIIFDALVGNGNGNASTYLSLIESVRDHLLREYGRYTLAGEGDPESDVKKLLLESERTEEVLDVIEMVFWHINTTLRKNPSLVSSDACLSLDDAITLLNSRFREHGVGYQFQGGVIVRVDSELLHQEVVKPLLAALDVAPFKGALAEYTKAHEHYRHGRNGECLNECLKSFESVMKAVCTNRSWMFDPSATAKPLIKVLFDQGFFPKYLETQIAALRNLLESGVPTIRNKNSGHGQGVSVTSVPEELASYGLHLTATNLLYIVKLA